jgi:hypothetical protein
LARRIAKDAAQAPERFAELARMHSEDLTTQPEGGSLGGIRGIDLEVSPVALDALAVLKPGEVSNVIETPQGFHVLYRRSPPREGSVSGSRIVIGYQGAEWLQATGGPRSRRSRPNAFALASEVYREASQNPGSFDQLVQRYSEHPDKSRGGYFGTWSVREPSLFRREIESLSKLDVGAVAPPLDTAFGFAILRRTPDRPRTLYAMESIQIPFDPEDAALESATRSRALEIDRIVLQAPERFADFQREYGSVNVDSWLDGRGNADLEAALKSLAFGQIGAEPVRQFRFYAIPRRVSPDRFASAARQATFELPLPEHLDLDLAIARFPGTILETEFRSVVDAAQVRLGLSVDQVRALNSLAARFRGVDADGERCIAIAHALLQNAEHLLGAREFDAYRTAIVQHFERVLMGESVQ